MTYNRDRRNPPRPPRPVPRPAYSRSSSSSSGDPNTAFIIELVGGYFGLLGLGYIYMGRTGEGIVRLVLWILYQIFAWVVISVLLAALVGVVCIPLQIVVYIGVPIWSAYTLKNG